MSYFLTEEQIAEVWERHRRGQTPAAIARHFGRGTAAMSERIRVAGGIPPTMPRRAERHLTLEEREAISRGLAARCSLREIARQLGRAPSTISREVNANGGRSRYRAATAEKAATVRRR
ncbi:MAG TPA: helix-turn-helix domain-containing protein [Nitriliruptorales bacterium]|nr:helix-turn-helix domain-containing protein [Nitriliruptorales bacterium]